MSNQDLFRKVKELNLPFGQYALFGSAPLGIRELRECRDIDLIVTEELWNEFKNKSGWEYKITENGVEHIAKGDIEIWHDWLPWYQDISKFIKNAEIIDGLPFVRLESIIEWKKKFGREKDLKDVELMEWLKLNMDKKTIEKII